MTWMQFIGTAILAVVFAAAQYWLHWVIFKAPPPKHSLYPCRICGGRYYLLTATAPEPYVCNECKDAIKSTIATAGRTALREGETT